MEYNTERELYDLGFRFKAVELWNELEDKQMFAVRLPDGSEGYCSVMGMLGLNLCLAMYLGKDGFSGYWKLSQPYKEDLYTLFLSLERNGLFCSYDDKEDVSQEEIKKSQKWARSLKAKLTRPYPYLHFERATLNRRMEPLEDEQEAQCMKLALQAGLYLSDLIEDGEDPYDLVPIIGSPTDEIPLLIPDSKAPGGFRMEKTRLPGFAEPERKVPAPLDEFTLARLKKCRATGTWDLAITYMFFSVIEEEDEAYIPSVPVCFSHDEDMYPPINAVGDFDNEPDKMFFEFSKRLIELNIRPAALRLFRWDTRAQAFVQPLVNQLNIPVELTDDMPDLHQFMMDMMHEMNMSDEESQAIMDMMITFIDTADVKDLRNAPVELQLLAKGMLEMMGDQLPSSVRKKIRACLKYWD